MTAKEQAWAELRAGMVLKPLPSWEGAITQHLEREYHETRKNQFHAVEYPHAVFRAVTGMEWKGDMGYFFPMVVNATAAQRASAFLKTIGKWQEKNP